MNHIKKFEDFDFSQTLPLTTKSFLKNYYSCDECDNLWTEYNRSVNVCPNCSSHEIEELTNDEWNEISTNRGLPIEKDNDELVDLLNINNVIKN